ncbi:MAG: bifunctional glutamate N-acetyltransferase/amino-acid acetyltransferase ArgJ [Actinobacteria bacterium]|nr:bifunctional glutamate N-acetyltransferase/amino-acid acetyltransferase ArgJ [Actinomycetota bacterium]
MSNIKQLEIKQISGGVIVPKGFKASGVACNIKQSGNKDIAVVVSEKVAIAAAVFTTNKMAAAPVHLSKNHIANGKVQAVVINSGNANACTGRQGYRDAEKMAEVAGLAIGINPKDIIISSTGIIGVPMPIQKVEEGIKMAVGRLPKGTGTDAAEAIMTTDTFSKEYAIAFELDSQEVRIGGMAKGSGMIAPNMATMLAVITTDALVTLGALDSSLKAAVNKSFNSITVDGDTSTNDMVVLLANGESGARVTTGNAGVFQEALNQVCMELAKLIVRDGEGATKFIEVEVIGAVGDTDAKKAAMAIANSNLVKTAFFGQDANWGRIVAAVGYSSADIDPARVDIYFGGEKLVENGCVVAHDAAKVNEAIKSNDIEVKVDLKLGDGSARMWTCDLSYDYVRINAEYHT